FCHRCRYRRASAARFRVSVRFRTRTHTNHALFSAGVESYFAISTEIRRQTNWGQTPSPLISLEMLQSCGWCLTPRVRHHRSTFEILVDGVGVEPQDSVPAASLGETYKVARLLSASNTRFVTRA